MKDTKTDKIVKRVSIIILKKSNNLQAKIFKIKIFLEINK